MVLWQPPWLTKSTPRWLAIGLQKLNTLVVINCLQKCCIAFEVLIKQTICLQKLCLKYFSNTHHSWVQDWSSCCKLLLRARNYKISNLKCYILRLFVHFKRRNNINRKMFCVLLFTWDHSNRFSWTYYFTNALLQKTGWWYNEPSSLTLGLNAWFWTS